MNFKSHSRKDDNLFRYIIQTFFPFWPLFLVLTLAFLLVGWAYIKFTTPVYEASASIMIKDQEKGVDESKIMESLNPFDSKKIVENEMEVIKSRGLMKKVVNELDLYTPVYEDKGIKITPAYTSSPVRIIVENPENISIYNKKPEKHFFHIKDGKVELSGKEYPLNEWVDFNTGQKIKFVKNDELNRKAEGKLFFYLLNPRIISNDLIEELEVGTTNKLSSVVTLTLKDQVPERAEDILNQLLKEYNQKIIEDQNELALNTMKFIQDRIDNVEKDLDQLEYKIENYRSNQGVIDLSEQGKLYLQDVGDNDKQISEIELQLTVLDNVQNYVVSKGSAGGIVPSTLGIEDPILSQLIEKLYNLEVEYEKLKQTTGENNPVLTSITDQINKIRPSILENVKSQKQNLQSRLSNLNSNNIKYNSSLSNLPEKERALLEINRKKTIKNNLFNYLLQKREETALANIQTNENSEMVDKAEASLDPVSPKPLLVYLIAFCLALGTGVSIVKGRELLSGAVLFRSEIEEHTSLPIIAEIFNIKKPQKNIFTKPTDFVIIEQFRQLSARLGLFRRNIDQKRILITSGSSSEGKSFISSNLAYSLANSGKKVALLDMDFRKGNTSKLFNLSSSKGIIGFLREEVSYEEIIQPSKVSPNLFIVSTGAEGDDYTSTLLNGKIEDLMNSLSEDFDYLIIDSAPIKILAEVNLMAEYSDRTLFVIRHGYTPKESIKRLDDSALLKSLNNISIVFNGIKNRGLVTTNYGYGYDLKHMMSSYAKEDV